MKTIVLISSFIVSTYSIYAQIASLCTAALKNYNRPLTVLEITTSTTLESHWIEKNYKAVCAVTIVGERDIDHLIPHCAHHNHMILLNPQTCTAHTLEKLIACEHFDIVIVHYPEQFGCETYLHLFEQLGDNLILACSQTVWKSQYEQLQGTILQEKNDHLSHYAWIQHHRSELRKSRWNFNKELEGYEVISTYTEKSLKKPQSITPTPWVPGINLMTAVALNVQYPTHTNLQECITNFKTVPHNDLVISNMIVQGKHLALIDFADPRRNAHQKKLLKIAHKFFGWRYKNITAEQKLAIYMNLVKQLKKH